MFNKDLPSVVLLVDASTSMDKHEEVVNKYLKPLIKKYEQGELKANLGISYFCHRRTPIAWGSHRLLNANGDTDIYGSCIDTLAELRQVANSQSKVLVMVVTDGDHTHDNRPKYLPRDVANEVDTAETLFGWDFLFVGTNQDAYRKGVELGIKPGKTLSFASSQKGFETMLETLDGIITKWIGGNLAHDADFFTKTDREQQRSLGATGRVEI